MSQRLRGFLVLSIAAALCGCSSDQPMNPAFPVTLAEANQILREMRDDPKPIERPVVVAAGYLDPGIISRNVARRLKRATSDDAPIISVSFWWAMSFDACRERLIRAVERKFPSDDPHFTTEVDVVGFSMGGLVARHAAAPHSLRTPHGDGEGKQLKIKRLFTIGTPHRGARVAPLGFFDRRAIDMRSESEFINALDEDYREGRYEILPYVRLHDAIVGEQNAAPPGRQPWWVQNKFLSFSHNMAGADERIIADIARRLRGEEPLTREPPAPVPE